MKRNGFTLAEVLITLTIIGVVATLTLPSLITNVQDAQAKTAVKKIINTITEVAQMSAAQEGYDYGTIAGNAALALTTSQTALVDVGQAGGQTVGQMFVRHGNIKSQNDNGCLVTFNDGTCITALTPAAPPTNGSVTIDVNGAKAPNTAMLTDANGRVTTHGDRFTFNIVDGHRIEPVANALNDAGFWALNR